MPVRDYTRLITSEHSAAVGFVTLVDTVTGVISDITDCIASMPASFDLDSAVGRQLDIVALWIGASRAIGGILDLKFFGFQDNPAALGFGELGNASIGGRLYELNEPYTSTTILADTEFRLVLRAKIGVNQSQGTLADLEQALQALFGARVVCTDLGEYGYDITVFRPLTLLETALLSQFDILPRTAGTKLGFGLQVWAGADTAALGAVTTAAGLVSSASLSSVLSATLLTRAGLVSSAALSSAASVALRTSTAGFTAVPALSSSATVALTTSVSAGLAFPRLAVVGVGGDQAYGNSAGGSWRTAATGSAAWNNVQQIGSFDLAILAGSWEGWDNGGARDREDLTLALAKQASYSISHNRSRPTRVFYYGDHTVSETGYATYNNLVAANRWYLYTAPGGTGSVVAGAAGGQLVDYGVAWPGAVGSVGVGQSIAGIAYGTLSTPSGGTGQGPARTAARYQVSKLLTKAPQDSRFTGIFNPQMASPSASGVFMDNLFLSINGAGSVANCSIDAVTVTNGSASIAQPILARGHHNFFSEMQAHLATVNPGKTYYSFGNLTDYGNKYLFGDIPTASAHALDGDMHGGLLEAVMGTGGNSWEQWETGGAASGWGSVRTNYYAAMDFCASPKLVCIHVRPPPLSGTSNCYWMVNGTQTTLQTNTELEYRFVRYALCTVLLDDGYLAIGADGYDAMQAKWYDEFGDDSLGQVNVPRGYMGLPLATRPTAPTWNLGTFGLWARVFSGDGVTTHGAISVVNPRGNGPQTLTAAMLSALGITGARFLRGTQSAVNSGAVFSSYTLQDGDGLILIW